MNGNATSYSPFDLVWMAFKLRSKAGLKIEEYQVDRKVYEDVVLGISNHPPAVAFRREVLETSRLFHEARF
jgi:hypothetical protein